MTDHQTPPHGAWSIDDAGIATVTIHGAKSMNIIGSPEILALTDTLSRLRDEPSLRVLVLRGRDDRAFIGGADIVEMAALTPASVPPATLTLTV